MIGTNLTKQKSGEKTFQRKQMNIWQGIISKRELIHAPLKTRQRRTPANPFRNKQLPNGEKGIQTERGNQNRKIIALNLEFKKLKAELSKLTSWIGSLLGSLQVKYGEYKQEKKKNMRTKRNSLISMSTSVFIMTYREKSKKVESLCM